MAVVRRDVFTLAIENLARESNPDVSTKGSPARQEKIADWLLPFVPVGDIWGIGRRTEAKLRGLGIGTAAELRAMPVRQARAWHSRVGTHRAGVARRTLHRFR